MGGLPLGYSRASSHLQAAFSIADKQAKEYISVSVYHVSEHDIYLECVSRVAIMNFGVRKPDVEHVLTRT